MANTEAFQQSRCERKKIEMRFAHMKRILRLDRLRLRRLNGVRDEVLLTAIAQKLETARFSAVPHRFWRSHTAPPLPPRAAKSSDRGLPRGRPKFCNTINPKPDFANGRNSDLSLSDSLSS
jgi:hypothetical protein